MFVDRVEISVFSGNGGAGAVSFRREKFVLNGGPDGGDGGDGGDVIFEGKANVDTLSKFRGKKIYRAKNGEGGGAKNCSGKRGENLTIYVPLGTQIINRENGAILADIIEDKQKVVLLKGGKGGLGNARFKTSVKQHPTYAQKGIKGENLDLLLELKLIADVGLVGYPNVGKSTLIASISNARPEIADYEFTTIIPNLGVVDTMISSFVIADIPGIIDEASEGKGLGFEFLRHIERTRILLFVLDLARFEHSAYEQLRTLLKEVRKYGIKCQKSAIVLSRFDAIGFDNSKVLEFMQDVKISPNITTDGKISINNSDGTSGFACEELKNSASCIVEFTKNLKSENTKKEDLNLEDNYFVLPISSATGYNLEILKDYLSKITLKTKELN